MTPQRGPGLIPRYLLGVIYLVITGLWPRTLLGWLLLAVLGLPAIAVVEWLADRFSASTRASWSGVAYFIAYGWGVILTFTATWAALRAIAGSWVDLHFWFWRSMR
jgi:hypothetical protein